MVEMTLASIRVHMPDNVPVLVLKEVVEGRGGRALPILIGHEEATAIAREIQGKKPDRPMTHDLIRDLLEAFDVTVEAVVVTELRQAVFFAEIRMRRDGKPLVVSSRPSDAIALAVRTGTTIYVEDELLDNEAVLLQEDEEEEEVIEEFQRFIERVRPEDFAS